MSAGESFEWLCAELERSTALDRLEARGTVRLTLREAGFDPRSVARGQLAVVVSRLLPKQLETRAVQGAAELCEELAQKLKDGESTDDTHAAGTPEDVFRRLAEG